VKKSSDRPENFLQKIVDRSRRKGYSLPYLYGLFSVPAPPLRVPSERRGFFTELQTQQEAAAKTAFQGHLGLMQSI
jgi:hypothetical protein